MKKSFLFLFSIFLIFGSSQTFAATSTFEDLTLDPEFYWNGDDDGSDYGTASGFISGDSYFANYEAAAYYSWEGFAYSNMTDTTLTGTDGQFVAYSGGGTGGGVNGSDNYAVAFAMTMWGQPAQIYNGYSTGEYAQVIEGAYFTNNAYAYHSMMEGDSYAKKFGGTTGEDEDWFLLTIHALDENYETTGASVDFYLADFRSSNSSEDYIIDDWTWVDLSGLGAVYGLEFSMSSSDGGSGFGMNTPAYFAMDDLTASPVPIPGSVLLLGSGLLGLFGIRRRPDNV